MMPLDIPDFNGTLRLMAVAWSERASAKTPNTSSSAIRWWLNSSCRASSRQATKRKRR